MLITGDMEAAIRKQARRDALRGNNRASLLGLPTLQRIYNQHFNAPQNTSTAALMRRG